MPARIKAHITKQFEKAFKHTSKAKHVLENKETKPYAQCVSLNKSLQKNLKTNGWKGLNIITNFKFNRAAEKTHIVIFIICVVFPSC